MARRSTWRNSAATVALAIGLAGGIAAPAFADFADGMAAYEAGDHARAMELWRPLAESGDAAAQYWVGRLFERGEGVPVSLARAAMWYRLAADQEDADAVAALDGVLDTLRAREAGQSGPQGSGPQGSGPQVADTGTGGGAAPPTPGIDTPDVDVPRFAPDRDPAFDPGSTPEREAGIATPGAVPGREGAPDTGADGTAVADAPPALPPRIGDATADEAAGAVPDVDADVVADAGSDPADPAGAAGLDAVADGDDGAVGADPVADEVGVDPVADGDVDAVDGDVGAGYDVAEGVDGAGEDVPLDGADVAAVEEEDGMGADGIGDGVGDDGYGVDGAEVGIGEDAVAEDEAALDGAALAALDEDAVVEDPLDAAAVDDPIVEDPAIDATYGPVDDAAGLDGALPPELAEAMADGVLEAEEIEALIEDGVVTPDMVDDLVDAGMLDADALAQLAEAGVLDAEALDALVDNGLVDEDLVADARAALDGDAPVTADGGTLLDDVVDGITTFVRGDSDDPATVAPPRRLITERQ